MVQTQNGSVFANDDGRLKRTWIVGIGCTVSSKAWLEMVEIICTGTLDSPKYLVVVHGNVSICTYMQYLRPYRGLDLAQLLSVIWVFNDGPQSRSKLKNPVIDTGPVLSCLWGTANSNVHWGYTSYKKKIVLHPMERLLTDTACNVIFVEITKSASFIFLK